MDRDRRFDDRRGGESYRPSDRSGRSPSRGYIRSTWSPPRNRSPRPVADTWVPSNSRPSHRLRSRSPAPPSFRRRSRSPSFRNRNTGIGYHARIRSPLRRFSPRREERPRSPTRPSWRSGSPYGGGRSPRTSRGRTPPKRLREPSSPGPYPRSPKRERLASPLSDRYMRAFSPSRRGTPRHTGSRGTFSGRSHSPAYRDGRQESYAESTSRRRSPSPPRPVPSADMSAQGSAATSRRSSPRVHTDRLSMAPSEPRNQSPVSQPANSRRDSRPPGPSSSYQITSPLQDSWTCRREEARTTSPKGKEHSSSGIGERSRYMDPNEASQALQQQVPARPAQPNGAQSSRIPANVTRNYATSQEVLLPSGPANTPMAASAQNRGSNISLLSAPTRPRGGPSFSHRENTRDPSWATTAPPRRGPMPPTHHGPPTGPRSTFVPASLGHDSQRNSSYRRSSSTSTTYPRSQKFVNQLSGLPTIIPGGKLLPSLLDSATEKRLAQLESDKEKLLEQIAEKQRLKRAGLKDWDKLDRESTTGALKSELAEGHLQRMAEGESVSGGAAF